MEVTETRNLDGGHGKPVLDDEALTLVRQLVEDKVELSDYEDDRDAYMQIGQFLESVYILPSVALMRLSRKSQILPTLTKLWHCPFFNVHVLVVFIRQIWPSVLRSLSAKGAFVKILGGPFV